MSRKQFLLGLWTCSLTKMLFILATLAGCYSQAKREKERGGGGREREWEVDQELMKNPRGCCSIGRWCCDEVYTNIWAALSTTWQADRRTDGQWMRSGKQDTKHKPQDMAHSTVRETDRQTDRQLTYFVYGPCCAHWWQSKSIAKCGPRACERER